VVLTIKLTTSKRKHIKIQKKKLNYGQKWPQLTKNTQKQAHKPKPNPECAQLQ